MALAVDENLMSFKVVAPTLFLVRLCSHWNVFQPGTTEQQILCGDSIASG